MEMVRARQKAVEAQMSEMEYVQEAVERASHMACGWVSCIREE